MTSKSFDSDHYVESDETSIASLISPGGPNAAVSAIIENLASYNDEKLEELNEILKVCEEQLSKSELTRSFLTDLAFEYSSASWKLEEKAQLAWNLSVIKLALARRALVEGSSELAWEALSSARYYSGYYEAAKYSTESPAAKRSEKGGHKKAEIADETTVLLSCLVKNQLIKNKPVRGWPNQVDTVKEIASNIVREIEEFSFPLTSQGDTLYEMLNKLFNESVSVKELYLKNRNSGR